MKFTCEKFLLLATIITASRATSSKSPVPLLEGLMLVAEDNYIRISAYDLKTGIVTEMPADVEEGGGVVLNARLFGEIIRKAPGQYVTITSNSGYVVMITSELSEFEILGSPPSDFPELPTVEGLDSLEIKESLLKKMISQTNFAVSDIESRPIYTGALFETKGNELTIVAVDGFRLALRREKLDNEDTQTLSFVVPGSALTEVERIISDGDNIVTITLGSKHIMFTIGETMLVSRRLEGEFLNYKTSIPQSSKYQLIIDKEEFIASVERVALIISDKLKSPVRCTFGENSIKLTTASELGKASDECSMEGNGDDVEMGFNDRYLLEALRAAPVGKLKLELTTGNTPCLLTSVDNEEDFTYMILPVRLKTYDN